MRVVQGPGGPLPAIPDDLTIPQFMLDVGHLNRPRLGKNRPWMIEEATGREVGEEELRSRTDSLANALKTRWNIGDEDVVCVYSPNHVDFPVMVWAVHRLGAVISTANPSYNHNELVHQLKTTDAKLIFVHFTCLAIVEAAARTVGLMLDSIVLVDRPPNGKSSYMTVQELVTKGLSIPISYTERKLKSGEGKTKIAFLNFSSGTTGLPKAVMVPHYAQIANIIQCVVYAEGDPKPWEDKPFRPGRIIYAGLPFYHVYGLAFIMHFGFFLGMPLVVSQKFVFTDMLKSIERYRITTLPCVPPMAVLLVKHPDVKKYDLSTIQSVMIGAAPVSPELQAAVANVFPKARVGQAFGMTESFAVVTLPRHDQRVGTLGSAGVLIPGVAARVVRPDGTDCAPDEPGQFLVKVPSLALGYLNNEQANKETFVDGWLNTGDEVIVNDQAELFVIDRIKELLKVRGFQVAPAELEGFILDHPDVSDVCVVSLLDDFNGDLPLAFVVPTASAKERMSKDPAEGEKIKAAIVKYVADGKISYKQLTGGVEFIDVIPRNPSGKLLRRFLRDKARSAHLKTKGVKAKL
ncbi:amp dependent CoA ligase [Fomitopsis serialis]|uniref:amp dependent CoA ligase n=1 Tax=Fomitopsis serialis TaxID=139415 RepID=UPI0020085CBB|nr:amp dependent CoA ligase [Neoantrodia serialis]KAH9915874.1 amp dependent CoA ligase [Neoantrodia serialis]